MGNLWQKCGWPEIFIFKLGSMGLPIDNRKFRVVKGVEVEMGGVQ